MPKKKKPRTGVPERKIVSFARGPAGTTSGEGWGTVNAIKKTAGQRGSIQKYRMSATDRKREGITQKEYRSYMRAVKTLSRRTARRKSKSPTKSYGKHHNVP